MTARYIVGDVFKVLAGIPDQSVDLVLTSPPFLALRSYLPADHPDKALELGSEPTPAAFIDTLLDLTEEWARLLTPHGSICIELGDTYSGSGGGGGDYLPGGLRENQPGFGGTAEKQREGNAAHWRQKNAQRDQWPEAKSLCLIPELYRIALVYGFNPLTGRQTPRWRARNVIRWCRPNPPVGALGDKMRPATSDMVVACKSVRRWFDLDAVRQPYAMVGGNLTRLRNGSDRNGAKAEHNRGMSEGRLTHDGAPPLDHWWHDQYDQDAWLIPTEPYKGSHYATWPTDLLIKPIQAMCPRRVCRVCGKPSERITEATADYLAATAERPFYSAAQRGGKMSPGKTITRTNETVGWSDCGHDQWRPGLVLDPFAGSGTTLAVATGHGRDAIGVDLDARNADLARERVGMFLEVEYPESVA